MEIQRELNNTVIMITHDVDEAVLLSDRIVMMTNGPDATIGEILNIDLERPRNRLELADDPRYNHFRHEVLRFLYEKQRKVEVLDKPSSQSKTKGSATEKSPEDKPAVKAGEKGVVTSLHQKHVA